MQQRRVRILAAFLTLCAPILTCAITHCHKSVANSCPSGFSYLNTELNPASSTGRTHHAHCKPDPFSIFSLLGFLTASFSTVVNIVNNISVNNNNNNNINNNNNNNNQNAGRNLKEEGLDEILKSGAGIFDPQVASYPVIQSFMISVSSACSATYSGALLLICVYSGQNLNNKEGFEQLNQYPSNFTTREFNLFKLFLNK